MKPTTAFPDFQLSSGQAHGKEKLNMPPQSKVGLPPCWAWSKSPDHRSSPWPLLVLSIVIACVLFIGCGKKSGLEGKVVDWNGKPVAGVKIVAEQNENIKIKGYEHFEAVTGTDGSFRFKKLYPSSKYLLKPLSEKWTTKADWTLKSGPEGETSVFPSPNVIKHAYLKSTGSFISDLATCETRFSVSPDGVISDSQTGLQWMVGPNTDMNWEASEEWATIYLNKKIAGAGWRLPTINELIALLHEGAGEGYIAGSRASKMDPAFRTSGQFLWSTKIAEGMVRPSADYLQPSANWTGRGSRDSSRNFRVLAVRSAIKQTVDTWKDPQSSLTWQAWPTGGTMKWSEAKSHCESLSLGGYSDWRLPTINELRSLIRGCPATQNGGACGVTDSCLNKSCWIDPCIGCSGKRGPGQGGAYWPPELLGGGNLYWSSSPVADDVRLAWIVAFQAGIQDGVKSYLQDGCVSYMNVNMSIDDFVPYVRCVR